MAKNAEGRREVLSSRLRRIEDDIERLSALEKTPEISMAIASLISELAKIESDLAPVRAVSLTQTKIKEIRALRYRGMSLDMIAEKAGIGRTSASRYCGDIPVDKRQSAKPRLTPPEWLDRAKSMQAEGKTRHVIAKELGIPLANFYRAFNRFATE